MKGIQGLIIAIGLGIVGALFNFAYLYSRSQETENEKFIGIKPNVTVARGDVLREEHLEPVDIPRKYAGTLKDFAYLWSGRGSEIGLRVARNVTGGSILLRDDMKTPPPQALAFSQNPKPGVEERALGVPIDSRRGVASLVEPGDLVTFIVPAGSIYESPTPAASDDDSTRPDGGSPPGPGKEPAKPDPAASRLKPVPSSGSARKSPGRRPHAARAVQGAFGREPGGEHRDDAGQQDSAESGERALCPGPHGEGQGQSVEARAGRRRSSRWSWKRAVIGH